MDTSNKIVRYGLKKAFSYIERDPEENLPRLMDWVDRFAPAGSRGFPVQRAAFRKVIENPDCAMHKLMHRIFTETDNDVLKAIFENFIINGNLVGWPRQEELREEYGCNIPWAILLDPTSACNLHCTGCWAAEYGNKLNLSFDEIDSIITQGKELGVYIYIYTGGEPLVRKKDLIALCRKHSDCQFLCFTNATLIDEEFAEAMLSVKNFIPAISVEGFESATKIHQVLHDDISGVLRTGKSCLYHSKPRLHPEHKGRTDQKPKFYCHFLSPLKRFSHPEQ